MVDTEKRKMQKVHIVSLQELLDIEDIYSSIIFSFEDIETLGELSYTCLQKLYTLTEHANQVHISLLRQQISSISSNKLKMKDDYIDWEAFNTLEYQELIQGYVEQGEPISINRMNIDDEQYYICYMDMPIGKMQSCFLDEFKKVWGRVYNKKLESIHLLPMKVEGALVRECVSCIQKNNTWMGIRLQGYVEIESRYN